MSSFAITDLPQGSIDGCAPTEAGWLARQSRRLLVLAGLIAGCWLLASILNGAQAKAAPVPVPAASAVKVLAADAAAKITHATQPVHKIIVAVPTTINKLSATVHATVAKVATTRHQVTPVIARVAPIAGPPPALSPGSPPAARTSAAVHGANAATGEVASRSTTPSTTLGSAAHPVAAQASTVIEAAARPAGPQRPTHVPSPAQPVGTGSTGAAGQTLGGTAISSLNAAFAPTSFMVSAPSSHLAAMLRSTRERPSVSPD